MSRLEYPHRAGLATAASQLFGEYSDYLLGKDVYRLECKEAQVQVGAKPTFAQLREQGYQVRTEFTVHLNEGKPISEALRLTWQDPLVEQ